MMPQPTDKHYGHKTNPIYDKSKEIKATASALEYAPPTRGLLSMLPSPWVPYAELIRLDYPHGIYIAGVPIIVGLAYGSGVSPSVVPIPTLFNRAGHLLLWAFLCRCAGCAWNDYVDQDVDRKTIRCRTRPIARGAIAAAQAHACTALFVLLAFLSIQPLPPMCTAVSLGTVALSAIYPFCKRFTSFPQAVLGLALGSTTVVACYSIGVDALSEAYRTSTLCLVGAIVSLIMFYDVVYARQDTEDDVESGVRSMAVLFRNHIKSLLLGLVCALAGILVALGNLMSMGRAYFFFSVAAPSFGLISIVAFIHTGMQSKRPQLTSWIFAFIFANFVGGFLAEYLRIFD